MSTSSSVPGTSSDQASVPPLRDLCLTLLLETQNADGGWSYQVGGQSATEPTSWALIALQPSSRIPDSFDAVNRGVAWLSSIQLHDGAWPSRPGQSPACWATALANLALCHQPEQIVRTCSGLEWLCKTWPAEGGLRWRLGNLFRRRKNVARQNSSLRGWSWIPRTASWVEPTAYSLILLHAMPAALQATGARERKRLGEAMLYDRMCPDGGWNSGNPLVYGVAGVPRVGPTVWALLALKPYSGRTENQQSLDWLERAYPDIPGPGSLALAHLCLQSHGRSVPPLAPTLQTQYDINHFLESALVTAWALMALNPAPSWLRNSD